MRALAVPFVLLLSATAVACASSDASAPTVGAAGASGGAIAAGHGGEATTGASGGATLASSGGAAGQSAAGNGGASVGNPADLGTPPAAKLLAWLKLDETSGLVAADASGNGNDATLSDAGSTFTTGVLGGALAMNGTSRLSMKGDLFGTNAFTVCAWYDATTAPWGATLVGDDAFQVFAGTGAFAASNDGTHGVQSTPIALPPSRWSHVCTSRDEGGTILFYVNGEASGGGDGGTPKVSGSAVTFGNHPYKDEGWAVTLDDIRVYDGLLTLEEARYLYMQGEANPSPKTVAATSCAHDDVQAAIDKTNFGDTVTIPAGTCTWTTTLGVGVPITLQGAGIDTTTIVDGVDFSSTQTSHSVLEIDGSFRGLVRLTGLTIDGGTGVDDSYNKGMLVVGGDGPWRVDHVRLHATRTSAAYTYASGGVFDHDVFDLDGWHYGIYGFNGGDTYGDKSWSEPLALGGSDAYFVEDCTFNFHATPDTSYSVASDGWTGQRVVFRHNTLNDVIWGNHGTESSGLLRGARSFEIYDNTLTFTGQTDLPYAIEFRSGNGVLFHNTITGLPQAGALYADNYRDWSPFAPWGQCDGTSPYDQDDAMTYDSGAATGDGGVSATSDGFVVLTDATKAWTDKQWVGYSLREPGHCDPSGYCSSSVILASTATTITVRWDNTHNPLPVSFASGDGYEIRRATACLDQMGRGAGDLVTRDQMTGIPTVAAWPKQAVEQAYVWGNTSGGAAVRLGSGSPHIVEGRDFVNDACAPGYAPYTYPHPLTGAPSQTQDIGCP